MSTISRFDLLESSGSTQATALPGRSALIPLTVVLMAVILFTAALVHFSRQWNPGTDSLKWACWGAGILSMVAGIHGIHNQARHSGTGAIAISWVQSALFVASLIFTMQASSEKADKSQKGRPPL